MSSIGRIDKASIKSIEKQYSFRRKSKQYYSGTLVEDHLTDKTTYWGPNNDGFHIEKTLVNKATSLRRPLLPGPRGGLVIEVPL